MSILEGGAAPMLPAILASGMIELPGIGFVPFVHFEHGGEMLALGPDGKLLAAAVRVPAGFIFFECPAHVREAVLAEARRQRSQDQAKGFLIGGGS